MQTKRRHSIPRFILALGIALPGFLGILAVQAKIIAGHPAAADVALQTAAPLTVTPSLPVTVTPPVQTSTGAPEISLPTSASILASGLYAFIEAPKGVVPQPYVILSAFSSL